MTNKRTIFVGADHAGFALKQSLLATLSQRFPQFAFEDLGTHSESSVHYPDFAKSVAQKVVASSGLGILVCGSGIGMAIAANKVAGIRAANVWDVTSARLSKEHNDSNVLCMGSRLTGPEVAIESCSAWLTASFQGGRHADRIELIRKMEGGTR